MPTFLKKYQFILVIILGAVIVTVGALLFDGTADTSSQPPDASVGNDGSL